MLERVRIATSVSFQQPSMQLAERGRTGRHESPASVALPPDLLHAAALRRPKPTFPSVYALLVLRRPVNGGMFELGALQAAVMRRRGSRSDPVSEDDIVRAIKKLKVGWNSARICFRQPPRSSRQSMRARSHMPCFTTSCVQ
jgi:hypothetical protein